MDSSAHAGGAADSNGCQHAEHDALQALEHLSREVLDSSVDSYAGMDSSGRVLEWNRAASQTFGWSREEAVGRLLTELIVPPRLARVGPGGHAPLRRDRGVTLGRPDHSAGDVP